jgi:hypothetical protein
MVEYLKVRFLGVRKDRGSDSITDHGVLIGLTTVASSKRKK